MADRLEGSVTEPKSLAEEQRRLQDEVQRLRDEQQRLRDEQQKVRDGKDAAPKDGEPQPEQKDEKKEDPKDDKKDDKPEAKKDRFFQDHPLRTGALIILLAVLAIAGFFLWGYLNSYESTDDAQVDGHINPVSSRIIGTVTRVYVEENQRVKAGQLLFEIDPRDYETAANQARASLAESQAQVATESPNVPITSTTSESTISTAGADIAAGQASVASAEGDYQAALAQLRQAEANNVKAQADVQRYGQLVAKEEVSREQYDQVVAQAKASAAQVDANRANAEASRKKIDEERAKLQQSQIQRQQAISTAPQQLAIRKATVQNRRATAERNKAALDQAMLNLQYTKIYSPVNGVVGRRTVEVGMQVQPGQELLAIVNLSDLWVTANFKETQLKRMKVSDPVTVKVDATGRKYDAYVDSLSGASGARYSLLPPENATGNYVKVVQRIPVRLRFKKDQDPDQLLRPGMSAEPKVWLK